MSTTIIIEWQNYNYKSFTIELTTKQGYNNYFSYDSDLLFENMQNTWKKEIYLNEYVWRIAILTLLPYLFYYVQFWHFDILIMLQRKKSPII